MYTLWENHYIILPYLSFEACNINAVKYTLLLHTYATTEYHDSIHINNRVSLHHDVIYRQNFPSFCALLTNISKRQIQDLRNIKHLPHVCSPQIRYRKRSFGKTWPRNNVSTTIFLSMPRESAQYE
jgi:hypothetical protein